MAGGLGWVLGLLGFSQTCLARWACWISVLIFRITYKYICSVNRQRLYTHLHLSGCCVSCDSRVSLFLEFVLARVLCLLCVCVFMICVCCVSRAWSLFALGCDMLILYLLICLL